MGVSPDNAAITVAGLWKIFVPKRWGGFELDYGRTQTELCNVLGRACGSSAWVQCVLACHAWCLAMFPSEAQEAVWSDAARSTAASMVTDAAWRSGNVGALRVLLVVSFIGTPNRRTRAPFALALVVRLAGEKGGSARAAGAEEPATSRDHQSCWAPIPGSGS